MNPIYTGLSEDDRFIGKLLTAQNVMVNIQTELTGLIKDYIHIKKRDQKHKEKKRQTIHPQHPYAHYPPVPPTSTSTPTKRKKTSWPQNNHQPSAKKPKPNTPKVPQVPQRPPMMPTSAPIVQGMLKTRKNNLTLEEGNKLKHQVASLSGPQQMTVLEILRDNNEELEQDEEGNVEMEFRDFKQKSIDDLKAYVNSVLLGKSNHQAAAPQAANSKEAAYAAQQAVNGDESESEEEDSEESSSSDSDSDSE